MRRVIVQPDKVWFHNDKGNICYGQRDWPMYEIRHEAKSYTVEYYGAPVFRGSSKNEGIQYILNHLDSDAADKLKEGIQ